MSTPIDVVGLCRDIHADNQSAGWWTDLATGESILATRNRAEILMLCVSELSEASEGREQGLQDDKLPHLPMWQVELADTAIRLGDVIGADVLPAYDDERLAAFNETYGDPDLSRLADGLLADESFDVQLMWTVNVLSCAMEGHRKGKTEVYNGSLLNALGYVLSLGRVHNFDLLDVIAQKRAYNAQRADHKIENRKADDGKKY